MNPVPESEGNDTSGISQVGNGKLRIFGLPKCA